jgi:tetratricopeptide (TPR) repeat protein
MTTNKHATHCYLASTIVGLLMALLSVSTTAFVAPNRPMAFATLATSIRRNTQHHPYNMMTANVAASGDPGDAAIPEPSLTTFREAEVLGLRLMQEGNYEEALKVFQKGMKLPGSNKDVVRTKSLSGPSPVGGSMGGFESQNVFPLDEFELQAAHYNIACVHAQLGNLEEVSLLVATRKGIILNFERVELDPHPSLCILNDNITM